jgi:hypothetical protein
MKKVCYLFSSLLLAILMLFLINSFKDFLTQKERLTKILTSKYWIKKGLTFSNDHQSDWGDEFSQNTEIYSFSKTGELKCFFYEDETLKRIVPKIQLNKALDGQNWELAFNFHHFIEKPILLKIPELGELELDYFDGNRMFSEVLSVLMEDGTFDGYVIHLEAVYEETIQIENDINRIIELNENLPDNTLEEYDSETSF